MSGFSTASSDTAHGQYLAIFTHTNGQTIAIESRFGDPSASELDPTEMDAAWAAAVALLNGSSDFTFAFAQKSYTSTQAYTP
jgi:hypothetical protein